MNNIEIFGVPYLKKGKGIHIKKKNRGKFTEYCGGKVTDKCILKAKKSKNPKLRKRATFAANARGWAKKHLTGGIFNPPKMIITEELKALAKTNPEEYSKLMQLALRLNLLDYAKAWYAERSKLEKYKYLLSGNIDKINSLLSQDGYVPLNEVTTMLGGKKPVAAGGLPVDGGFVTADKSITGKPFWFGKSSGVWWHEGIGHWLGDLVPGLLSKNPGIYMNYLYPEYDLYGTYQQYINRLNEKHSDTWWFRGMNKNMKDANGNLYIDPNRQLTPDDVLEMLDKGAKLPDLWKDTDITPEEISNMHNTFADASVRKNNKPFFAKKGNKIHKPNGHRSILDNGWIPTKRLKKGTYGLIKKHRGGGSAIPTVEEYIALQIEARKQAALDKSLTRTLPAYPLKNEVMSEQEWNDSLVKREQSTRNSVLPQSIKALNIVGIDSERRAGYANYVGSNCIGPTCAKTAADNYGVDFIGSQLFRDNHADYGFKKVDNKSVKPGDIVIDVELGLGSHTMMFNRKDNNNVMRFNHSNGGFLKENIRKDAKYPFKGVMETYTFVGTPSDSILWRNEYKHKYE